MDTIATSADLIYNNITKFAILWLKEKSVISNLPKKHQKIILSHKYIMILIKALKLNHGYLSRNKFNCLLLGVLLDLYHQVDTFKKDVDSRKISLEPELIATKKRRRELIAKKKEYFSNLFPNEKILERDVVSKLKEKLGKNYHGELYIINQHNLKIKEQSDKIAFLTQYKFRSLPLYYYFKHRIDDFLTLSRQDYVNKRSERSTDYLTKIRLRVAERQVAELTQKLKEKSDNKCQICFNLQRDTFFSSCGHSTCEICYLQILVDSGLCPFCKKSLGRTYKMFL